MMSLLSRANQGYLKPLDRLLLLSYGRIGKRRRELVTTFVAEMGEEGTGPTPDFHSETFTAPSQLIALVKSQMRQPAIRDSAIRFTLKQFSPPIPEEDQWGRPLAVRRKVNIRKRWYARVLDTMLPFLPEQDLGILHGLISGEEEWRPPKRRAKVLSQASVQASTPALTADFLLHGAPKGPTYYAPKKPHIITRRLMRHLWLGVCAFTPRMAWDERKKMWSIAWGYKAPPKKAFIELEQELASALFPAVVPKPKTRRQRMAEEIAERSLFETFPKIPSQDS